MRLYIFKIAQLRNFETMKVCDCTVKESLKDLIGSVVGDFLSANVASGAESPRNI